MSRQINFVYLGCGGHGLYPIIRASRGNRYRKVAITSCADSGGGSGKLRRANTELLPPGDNKQLLLAASLLEPTEYELYERLLQYRYTNDEGGLKDKSLESLVVLALSYADLTPHGSGILKEMRRTIPLDYVFDFETENGLERQSVGNLVLVACQLSYGKIEGIERIKRLLKSDLDVIPVSLIPSTLCFKDVFNREYYGEHLLDEDTPLPPITDVWLDLGGREGERFGVPVYEGAKNAVLEADILWVGPGSMIGTIEASVPKELRETIQNTNTPIVFALNAVTEPNQTLYTIGPNVVLRYSSVDHVNKVTSILGRMPTVILAHDYETHRISTKTIQRYTLKNALPVEFNHTDLQMLSTFCERPPMLRLGDILHEVYDSRAGGIVIRHNPESIREITGELVNELCY